ncbi:hypothetical protein D3C87_1818250 [compost metagenome]
MNEALFTTIARRRAAISGLMLVPPLALNLLATGKFSSTPPVTKRSAKQMTAAATQTGRMPFVGSKMAPTTETRMSVTRAIESMESLPIHERLGT